MSRFSLDPDDPRLTAYALGELPAGDDRAAVERLLDGSPEARADVEEIRALVALLEAEYENERRQPPGPEEEAGGITAVLPAGVIRFPAQPAPEEVSVSRGQSYPWLKMAAAVIFLAALGGALLPPWYHHNYNQNQDQADANQSAVARSTAAPVLLPTPGPAAAVAASASAAPVTPAAPSLQNFASLDGREAGARLDAVGGLAALSPSAKPLALAKQESARAAATFARDEPRANFSRNAKDGGAATALDGLRVTENPFLAARTHPVSTFPLDVGTASYAEVRRSIESGTPPPKSAVRIEEMLNAFPSANAPPAADGPRPFALGLEAAECPWNTAHRLVRVVIKGRESQPPAVAGAVEVQVEFNPAAVASYRLIGGGVSALYEVIPAPAGATAPGSARMLTLKLRYRAPGAAAGDEHADEQPLIDHPGPHDLAKATPDFKFAAAVAGFGLVLQDSPYKGDLTMDAVVELAREGQGADAGGERAGFIELAHRAQAQAERGKEKGERRKEKVGRSPRDIARRVITQKAEGRRQKAEGGRRKDEGGRMKAEG